MPRKIPRHLLGNQSPDMDVEDKHRVGRHMRSKGWRVIYNLFLYVDNRAERKTNSYMLSIGDPTASHWRLAARPDVVCYLGDTEVVIEIDGAIHKFGIQKRDKIYDEHKINYIVINKADLRESKTEWEDYLDAQLREMHL